MSLGWCAQRAQEDMDQAIRSHLDSAIQMLPEAVVLSPGAHTQCGG